MINERDLMVDIDALEKIVTSIQTNVEFTITTTLTVLGVAIAIAGVALYLVAKAAISNGIEKGIEKTNKKIERLIKEEQLFRHAYGNVSVSVHNNNIVQITGLLELNKLNFIGLTILNKDGLVLECHSIEVKEDYINARLSNYDIERDGVVLYWNLVWRDDKFFENYLSD